MGAARLLGKGWIVFCVYAGGLALGRAAQGDIPLAQAIVPILVCVLLFGAMGVLFIAGYGLSASHLRPMLPSQITAASFLPRFNEAVFLAFTLIVFFLQVFYVPVGPPTPAIGALESAVRFAVFGQGHLENALNACGVGGGRLVVSAVSWLLALVFLGSAISRIRLAAGILRLERKRRPEALGAQPLAFAVGLAAVIGIQLLYIGTVYTLLPCRVLGGLLGDAVIGLGPLMLGYVIMAALTNLLALGPEA
ncbi:MAG TPA: hypothetical protein VGL35_02480 [Rhizomicrobium sp.]|jgi:hypothetical protein